MYSLIDVHGRDIRIEGRLIRVGRPYGDRYRFLDNPEQILTGLRDCGKRVDLLTFMQRLPETLPKYPYPMEWDNLAVLTVSNFDSWWKRQVDNKTRNMVRKAEKKGVVLREVLFDDALVQGIWEIYNECPVRQGRPFRHYGKNIERVHKEEMTFLDSSIFIGAFFDSKMIGFAKLLANETWSQAGLLNIISMIQHRDKAPTNALIARAVQCCAERGIQYLVYGAFAYGKKERDSATDFKENNGFKRVDVPRYYVPLTRLGWVALRLGFHHRFIDRLPVPIAAKVRELRRAWYNRKLPVAKEAT